MAETKPRDQTLIGVSLKLYLDPERTLDWSRRVASIARTHEALGDGRARLIVFPSTPLLVPVIDIFRDTPVQVGAQDMFWEDRGAFTGAVSGSDLAQLGCQYVEIGHAERRQQFGDDEDAIRKKIAAALRNGLTPLVCIGEPRGDSIESARRWCLDQLDSSLGWLDSADRTVCVAVAYEPVWAIGQDEAASQEYVVAVAGALRVWLRERPYLADSPLIYGGSAGPGQLRRLGNAVDGLFLGRFAHDPEALASVLDEIE